MKTMIFLLTLFAFNSFAANKTTLFVALTPAGSFEAVSEKMKGNLIKSGGMITADKLWVSIESFKTGIDLRDEHFWKHLNSSKNSKAVMTEVKGQNGKATAMLEVNGVKKPVSMSYTESGSDVRTNFTVKASDFGLPPAKYLGVGVNDDVRVEAVYPVVQK
jgi:polyisoprenoid-binding protein YceI